MINARRTHTPTQQARIRHTGDPLWCLPGASGSRCPETGSLAPVQGVPGAARRKRERLRSSREMPSSAAGRLQQPARHRLPSLSSSRGRSCRGSRRPHWAPAPPNLTPSWSWTRSLHPKPKADSRPEALWPSPCPPLPGARRSSSFSRAPAAPKGRSALPSRLRPCPGSSLQSETTHLPGLVSTFDFCSLDRSLFSKRT